MVKYQLLKTYLPPGTTPGQIGLNFSESKAYTLILWGLLCLDSIIVILRFLLGQMVLNSVQVLLTIDIHATYQYVPKCMIFS